MIKVCQKKIRFGKKMGPNSLCLIESGVQKFVIMTSNINFVPIVLFITSRDILHHPCTYDIQGKSTYEEIILVKKPNEFDEIWNGKLLSSSEISKKYKIKKCEYLCNLEDTSLFSKI